MLEDYRQDFSKVYSWLSWGGLILPEVVRNKDGSLMGFIHYGNSSEETVDGLHLNFPKGWSIWLDQHHFPGDDSNTLCLSWNLIHKNRNSPADNLYEGISSVEKDEAEYFRKVLQRLGTQIASCRAGSYVLEFEEVLSYMKSTLHMQACELAMPKIPLYLDAVLSRDMVFKVYPSDGPDKNRLTIRDKEIVVVSIKENLSQSTLDMVLKAFRQMNYRFCRRVLFMPEDYLQHELRKLTQGWCPQRQTIRDYMLAKHKGNGGMISNTLVFALDKDNLDDYLQYIREILEAVEIPFVLESYNNKPCWWGTLPGMFRANGRILPSHVSDWQDFLCLKGRGEVRVQA